MRRNNGFGGLCIVPPGVVAIAWSIKSKSQRKMKMNVISAGLFSKWTQSLCGLSHAWFIHSVLQASNKLNWKHTLQIQWNMKMHILTQTHAKYMTNYAVSPSPNSTRSQRDNGSYTGWLHVHIWSRCKLDSAPPPPNGGVCDHVIQRDNGAHRSIQINKGVRPHD